MPPRQCFPGREKKHVTRHPSVPLRESAPISSGFTEKSSEPVRSWYFPAWNAAPSLPPGKSHPVHPAFLPAVEPRNTHRHWAEGQGFLRKGVLREGRQPCHERRCKFTISQRHFPNCRNHNCPLYVQSRRGCLLGAVPAQEHGGFAMRYL